jgi:hypothetical protein
MKRSSLVTVIVFVAGLAVGYFARDALGTLQQRSKHPADLAAIEKLRQKNIGRGHGRLSRKVKLENAEGREKSLQASLVYGARGEEKSKHPPSQSEDGHLKSSTELLPGHPPARVA